MKSHQSLRLDFDITIAEQMLSRTRSQITVLEHINEKVMNNRFLLIENCLSVRAGSRQYEAHYIKIKQQLNKSI